MGLVEKWSDMDLTEVRNSRLKWEQVTNKSHTNLHTSSGPEKLKIVHLFGALMILCSGLACSVISLLYEIFVGEVNFYCHR